MSDKMSLCKRCDFDRTCMSGYDICADCYWDEDHERKVKQRSDPKWVFNRVYSAAIQLLNKTPEEAIQIASAEVERRFGKQK